MSPPFIRFLAALMIGMMAHPSVATDPAVASTTTNEAVVAEAIVRKQAIEELLVVTQMPEAAKLIERMFSDKLKSEIKLKKLTREQQLGLNSLMKAYFTAKTFEQSVRAGVTTRTADLPLSTLLEFNRALKTPFVQHMQTYELAALDERKRAGLEAYEARLKERPPPPARVALVGRYLTASGSADQMARLNEQMARRMLLAANPGIAAAELESRLATLRPQLVESATSKGVMSTLAEFREADDHALQQYVEILERPTVMLVIRRISDVLADEINLMMGRILQSQALMASGVPLRDIERQISATSPTPESAINLDRKPVTAEGTKSANQSNEALALASINPQSNGASPESMVAARVNGMAITLEWLEQALAAEHNNTQSSEAARIQARKAMLEKLVDQMLIYEKAVALTLDQQPNVPKAPWSDRFKRVLMNYSDRLKFVISLPTTEDVAQYFSTHPALFTARRSFHFEETAVTATAEQTSQFESGLLQASTPTAVKAILTEGKLSFKTEAVDRWSEQLPIERLDQFAAMKDGQVTLSKNASGFIVLQLVHSELKPVTLEQVSANIERFLFNQRIGDYIANEVKTQRAAAKIEYFGEFAPASSKSVVSQSSVAVPLPEQAKAEFIEKGVQGCLAKQRQDPATAKSLSASQINDYCFCALKRVADAITLEDIGRAMQTKSDAYFLPMMESASNACIQELAKKAGNRSQSL